MNKNKGFTLVEIMVVVAIMGILAAIAIPQFTAYQGKAQSSEAKLNLAGIHTVMESFYFEVEKYASCLYDMGYQPASYAGNSWIANGTYGSDGRHYTIGFGEDSLSNPAASGTVICNQDRRIYIGTKMNNAVTALPLAPAILATGNSYTAQAIGTVHKDYVGQADGSTGDSWTINQDKQLVHERTGY